MKATETLQCWTEGPDRMEEWNIRSLEVSNTWESLWGQLWAFRWETDPDLALFFNSLVTYLEFKAAEIEYLYPMFEVTMEMDYTFVREASYHMPTLSGFPWGAMRSWQTSSGKWIGVIARLEGVTLTPFDPRSLSGGIESIRSS